MTDIVAGGGPPSGVVVDAEDQAAADRLTPDWLGDAVGRLEALVGAAAGDPLSRRMAGVGARAARMNGACSLAEALSAAVATPFVALLDALRADYAVDARDPRLVSLGEATLALYLYVRVQDDMVDEPQLFDPGYVYAADVLSQRSQQAFSELLGADSRFVDFRARTMTAFAGAATWELDVLRAGLTSDADPIELCGRKFLPMAVPLGALALLAGRPQHLTPLTDFVVALGTGLQLVNDILNVEEDHAAHRLTPVLCELEARGRVPATTSPARLRAALLADPALPSLLGRATEAMQEAREIACSIDAVKLAAVAAERIRYAQTVPDRLFALLLGAEAMA